MKKYNWWNDPKNEEEIKRISWWDHDENKTQMSIPISVIEKDGHWTVAANKDTKKIIGNVFDGVVASSSESREDAIERFLKISSMKEEFQEDCMREYQRWVPVRVGDWNNRGGKWISIFGFHVYFRYGKGMKGGFYIPFSILNVSFSSDWSSHRNYKNKTNGY